jgi:hypothetical protein
MNAEIKKRTDVKNLAALAHSLKWRWGGHVAIMDQSRGAYDASMWDVRTGKTGTGKPKTQWADMLKKAAE